jgi:N-acyl amino acid synthase of PEP-CTERM/exosortase system
MAKTIAESFRDYFEMVPADTDDLKRAVYHLRYQVYCLETGFEKPEDCPSRLERDAYDDRADHFLIRHLRTGEYAATTRLILPDRGDPSLPFPIESHCAIDRPEAVGQIPRTRLGEVSRFCVSKDFKRRRGEPGTLAGVSPSPELDAACEEERRTFPYITLGLIACLVRISRRANITHWYAVMEPALIRFLEHLGIHFTPIGPLADYHGRRLPCIIEVAALLGGVERKNPEVWELLTDGGKFWKDGL